MSLSQIMLTSTKLLTWSVFAIQLIGTLASPAVPLPLEVVHAEVASASEAEELVLTPAGKFPKSQVHEVPGGGRVEHDGETVHILSANGTTVSTAEFANLKRSTLERRNLPNGYVVLAYWSEGSIGNPINRFTSTWTVPDIPQSITGQTIFIFNGLEPSVGDAILQPVLQWGPSAAGGGNYWSIASWWVGPAGVFYTTPLGVTVGSSLTGVMTLESITTPNGVTTYNYNSVFSGFPLSSLSISSTRELPLAFEALEIYNTQSATGLPRGRTEMRDIDIVRRDGSRPSVSWVPTSNSANGFGVQIVANGVPHGRVDLIYPNQ
ncbi:hypothetical protein JR316_0004191 [Psilocybe cubensis]|uniref:Uncharacterized protein n=2 Tax=Psilocybe cubensis TaxID=181762 RepID=A0ACB8H3L5_PSICU|nr:hypothetical protein JR316_0004191 [Psilocybe cubensis]KAH9482096.1 hypothetical protein JR316_0004191 [Psilocybe cubensis]